MFLYVLYVEYDLLIETSYFKIVDNEISVTDRRKEEMVCPEVDQEVVLSKWIL